MLNKASILIVEDECMIGLDLSFAVEDHDGIAIGPVATVAEALELLETADVEAAILDAELADRDVTPLALELIRRGVPFVVQTGTGLPQVLAREYPDLKVFCKPTRSCDILTALSKEMGRSQV